MPLTYLKNGKEISNLADAFRLPGGRFDSTRAGTEKVYELQVRNDYKGDALAIDAVMTNDPDAQLIEYPKTLKLGQTGEVKIRYSPAKDREKGFTGIISWEADVADTT